MRKPLWLLALALAAIPAFAQRENPDWELYFGYQYTRLDSGAVQGGFDAGMAGRGLPRVATPTGLNMHGWNVAVQQGGSRWWGVMADFSGAYLPQTVNLSAQAHALGLAPASQSVSGSFTPLFHTLAIGPQFTYTKDPRFRPFVHVLVGAAILDLAPDPTTASVLGSGFDPFDAAVVVVVGGGAEVPLNRRLAWRVSADYLRSELFSQFAGGQNSLRVSTGLVVILNRK